MVETGEGSNTAITAQLISIGVTERISVTPSMFTQAGRESSSKKQAERMGEEERYSITQRSLLQSRCSFKYFCVWFYLWFFLSVQIAI